MSGMTAPVAPARPIWLILGGSSSIGRAFARRVAAEGSDVILAGRDTEDLERTARDVRLRGEGTVEIMRFDASAYDTHAAFAEVLNARTGVLSIFLLFGIMPEQASVEADFELARETVEVNYLGAVSVLLRLAPLLEERGEGHVVVLSSVAGDRGRLKNYVYGSAKAGLNAFVEGLRARLWRRGVSVTLVKAGFMDTGMSFGHPGMFLVASPEACAEACLRSAERGRETIYFPWFWRCIMLIIRSVPARIFKRLNL